MPLPKFLTYRLHQWRRFFSLSIMDRYLGMQLIPPFCFSVGLVATLGVAIGYLSDLANKIVERRLPLLQAAEILILKVPEFVAYALPISIMLTTLMTYGRLSSDSELIALRSSGASLFRIAIPALFLSLWVTGATFFITEWVVPSANYRVTSILVNSIKEEHAFWQNKDIFYPEFEEFQLPSGEKTRRLKSLVYAEKFDGKKMKELTVLKWSGDSLNQIVISNRASWNPRSQQWDFFNGIVYKLAADASYREALPFDHKQLSLPKAAFDFAMQGRDPYEMNIREAHQYMKILRLIGDRKKLTFFEVRTEQKSAFPFVCVVFALVGTALGSRPQQISRATSFGLSIAIIFSYYLLAFFSGSLGMMELVSPGIAAWLPNIIGVGVGSWLLYQFNR
ncbi:MAG: LptF/LptG family permease [Microcystaceae cyanobacterium]